MRLALMALLGAAVVVTMRLSGVVLVSALLVLPGATALRLSRRLSRVFALSCAVALAGVFGGLVTAFESDLPPGACIAIVLTGLYALAWVPGWIARRRA
jgi:zinc transport system permease protein